MQTNKLPLAIALLLITISLLALGYFMVSGIYRPQNAVPSRAAGNDTCQGNTDAPAICFKCKRTTNPEPVGVLDYGCFFANYGKNVGR